MSSTNYIEVQYYCDRKVHPCTYYYYESMLFWSLGGGFYLLGVQALAVLVLIVWSSTVTFILLFVSVEKKHN